MSDLDEEMLADFLVEGWEQIETLDQEFVRLEEDSEDLDRVEGIFRVMHTLKGGAGFLNLPKLESITHHSESLLSLVWEGEIEVEQPLIDLLLEAADMVKAILTSLENDVSEGNHCCKSIIERLDAATKNKKVVVEEHQEESEESAVSEEELSPALNELESYQAELMAALGGELDKPAVVPEPEPEHEHEHETELGRGPSADDAAAEGGGAEKGRHAVGKQIRVKVELLDKLMNLVGELVLSRNQLLQLSASNENAGMEVACQRINLVTSELQENILQARMQPIDTILKRFPRLVRDLATQTGKEVRLTMEGEETGLDRTILEAIKDPLTHILRNSIDHGIELPEERRKLGKPEQGTIHIRAFHEGGQVTIEFIDNGRGVDLEKVRSKAVSRGLMSRDEADNLAEREVLNLLFHPGFSTADKITNLSGRGVGMDVVKTSTEGIGGTIDIQSKFGEGTVVRLRLPLTLAIVPALVVVCDGQRYAIPQVSLQEMVRLPSEANIESLYGGEVYRLRGELLPLLRLRRALGNNVKASKEEVNIVVIRTDNLTFGLIVDDVLDTEEIVVKPLSRELKALNLYAGATIMGDGRIALILDVAGLAISSRLEVEEQRHFRQGENRNQREDHPGQSLLLFNLADQRHAIPLSLVARLEEISSNRLEVVAGKPMVHYRNRLLPLIDLAYELGQGSSLDAETLQVLVFTNGERSLGLAVDAILDVVEQDRPVQRNGMMPGLLGSTIIEGRAVAMVDIQSVISNSHPEWLESGSCGSTGKQVLMVGRPGLQLSFSRSHLETAGHRVVTADNRQQALLAMEGQEFDCAVLDAAMPDCDKLAAQLRTSHPEMGLLGFNDSPNGCPDGVTMVYGGSSSDLLLEIDRLSEFALVKGAA